MDCLYAYKSSLLKWISTKIHVYYTERFRSINNRQIQIGKSMFMKYQMDDSSSNVHQLHIAALCYHDPDAIAQLAYFHLQENQKLTLQILKWYKYAADCRQPDACKAMVDIYIKYAPDEVITSAEVYAMVCLEQEDICIDVIKQMANFYLERYRSVKLSSPGCESLKLIASRLYTWCSHGYTQKCPQLSINLAILIWKGIGVGQNMDYAMAIVDHVSKFKNVNLVDLLKIKATFLCDSGDFKQLESIRIPKGPPLTSNISEMRLLKTLQLKGREFDSIQKYMNGLQDDTPRAIHTNPYKFLYLWPYICYTKYILTYTKTRDAPLDGATVNRLSEITTALPIWKEGHSAWPPIASLAYDCLTWNLVWIWKSTTSQNDPCCELSVKAFLDENTRLYIEAVWAYQTGRKDTLCTFRQLARDGVHQALFWISIYLYNKNRNRNRYSIPDHLKNACNKGMMPIAAKNLAAFYSERNESEKAKWWKMKFRGLIK